MNARTPYIHGSEKDEQDRLELQHRLLGGASFLPPLHPGMKVLELGSGTGAIAREIGPKVFPGTVTGIDNQPGQVEKARSLARGQGLGNVEFLPGDADSLKFSDGSFDLAYCRFLLEHVPDPGRVIREMARVTQGGGTVVACECFVGCGSTTEPPIPNASRALDALYRLQKLKGGDPHIAERLESAFAQAGLEGIQADTLTVELKSQAEVRGYASGGSQMLKTSEAELLEKGLLSREALDKAYQEWEDFARAPGASAWFKLRRVKGMKPGKTQNLLKAEVVILYVEDILASRRFYEGALGFKTRLDAGSYCELDLGGIGLGLMPKKALPHFLGETGKRPWSDGAPRCELYLLTEKPDEAVEKLTKAGARCLKPLAMRPWGDEAAYFEDPDGHILAVAKRTDKFYEINYPSGGPMEQKLKNPMEKISSFFEQDHREIDAILGGVPFGSPKEAVAPFKEFDRRLERHIHWEEGILFPAVSAKAPQLEMGPIRVMKMEHEEIRKHKAAALHALREQDGKLARSHSDAMLRVLKDHNAKEEQILYPACDQMLPADETKEVMDRVRYGKTV